MSGVWICNWNLIQNGKGSYQLTPKSNTWSRQSKALFSLHSAVTSDVRLTSVFRSPVTPVLQRCPVGTPSVPVGAPVAFRYHDGGARTVRTLVLFHRPEGDCKNRAYGLWAVHIHRVGRRCEEAAEDGGFQPGDHHRHRVRALLGWTGALCGAWGRTYLVLRHRAEAHLLWLRHRGHLPGARCDRSGQQSNRSQGECVG